MQILHLRCRTLVPALAALVSMLAMCLAGSAAVLRPFSPRVAPTAQSMAYAELARDYHLLLQRSDIRKPPPATAAIMLGSIQAYMNAYYAAAANVSYIDTSQMDSFQSSLNGIAAALPTVNPATVCTPQSCTTVGAAISMLNVMATNVNVLNGTTGTYARIPLAVRSRLLAIRPMSVADDYNVAGNIIASAFVFCALVFVLPLTTAAVIAIAAGLVVGAAAYAFATVTNAPENEFISTIADTSDGALVATTTLAGVTAALPVPIQAKALNFITAVTPLSRTVAKGLVPALQPITSVLTLLVAAQVYQSKKLPPKFLNPPLYPTSGSPANEPVETGTGVCIQFNKGGTICW